LLGAPAERSCALRGHFARTTARHRISIGPVGLGRPVNFHRQAFRYRAAAIAPTPPHGGRWRRPVAAACASTSDPPVLPGPSSRTGQRVIRRRRPGRLSRPSRRRAVLLEQSERPSHRPGRGASPEVHVPLQRSLAVPRCPGLPASGRSRYGVGDRLAKLPAVAAPASVIEAVRCVRDAWRDGRLALAVFRLCPPRRPFSPVVTDRAPVRTGHAPPLLHGRCSATRASRRTAWPMHPAYLLHRRRSWGFRPSRRCSRPRVSRRLRRPSPPAVSPMTAPRRVVKCVCPVGSSAGLPPTIAMQGRVVRASPAAAPGLRPRVRSVPRRRVRAAPTQPMPPWALPLSGLGSSPSCPC
jgi:hypothetical protein